MSDAKTGPMYESNFGLEFEERQWGQGFWGLNLELVEEVPLGASPLELGAYLEEPPYLQLGKQANGPGGRTNTWTPGHRCEFPDPDDVEEGDEHSRQVMANAYLLASANDLYHALHGMMKRMLTRDDLGDEDLDAICTANGAFRKAHGEWHDIGLAPLPEGHY